jgi:hypothetical protein
VEEFLRAAEELIERAEHSMCNTHIIIAARGEVTGESLRNQFKGYTRVVGKEEKEQEKDEKRIDQTEIVVSNFPSKVLHLPWSLRVGDKDKICKVYRMIEFLKHRIDEIELIDRGRKAEYMRFSRVINPCSVVSIIRNMRKNAVVLQYGKCGTREGNNCTTADGICMHMDIISTCRHPLHLNKRGFETDIREIQSEWHVHRAVEKEEEGKEEEAAINVAQEGEAGEGELDEANIPLSK